MDTRPIGVFDSGLGGLTAVRQLRRLLPGEDIVYFGDTGRVPYGSRGHDVIVRYAQQDIRFLLSQNVFDFFCCIFLFVQYIPDLFVCVHFIRKRIVHQYGLGILKMRVGI